MAVSMKKLYNYLNWLSAFIIVFFVLIFISNMVIYSKIRDLTIDNTQFIQNSIDNARQNLDEDLLSFDTRLRTQEILIDNVSSRLNYIADQVDNITWTSSTLLFQLVHYVADVKLCSIAMDRSYTVRVDFYWINPRVEFNRLLIIESKLTSLDENVYLPIMDKYDWLEADVCWINIISSNK